MVHNDVLSQAESLVNNSDPEAKFAGAQWALNKLPASYFIENYLDDNEGRQQSLNAFPMMRQIYNTIPQKLLLKCSRKTLKSTLLSNIICLNLIRWNRYNMMYVGPQELTVKNFSTKYVAPRFSSNRVKKLLIKGWEKNDVFDKILGDSGSSCLFRYCKDDATRIRGPAVDHIEYDEVQDIAHDQLPIIKETMGLSEYKREIYAGTPLSTDNTIHQLWEASNMLEWAFKCESCNHWNTLTMDNKPLNMIKERGFSCSKCGRVISTRTGEWVSTNPARKGKLVGYHLAQPLLPFFNESPKEWSDFFNKVTLGSYNDAQIYNEALGIAYDIGTKPITREELVRICDQGDMFIDNDLALARKNRHRYQYYAMGADWGVSGITSRTAGCLLAMKEDGTIDCLWGKTYRDFEFAGQIREIAKYAKDFHAKVTCDSGPDPVRGHDLGNLVGPANISLARYEHGKLIQHWDSPPQAWDWKQNRWCLHRSDTLSMVFKVLKSGKLRFPNWEHTSHLMQDILNEFIEIKEGEYRQEIMYRHAPDKPDDFLHALNYALCTLLMMSGDTTLGGPSSSASEYF